MTEADKKRLKANDMANLMIHKLEKIIFSIDINQTLLHMGEKDCDKGLKLFEQIYGPVNDLEKALTQAHVNISLNDLHD